MGSDTLILANRADNSNSISDKAGEGSSKTRPLLLHVSSKISVNADETMVQMLVRNKRRRTEADPVRVEIKVRDSLDRNIEIIGDSTSEIIL